MSSAQEKQNRRLLEELAQHKQILLSQGGGGAPTSAASIAVPPLMANPLNTNSRLGTPALMGHGLDATDARRNARVAEALQAANTNSVGFFVPQDSSFGNLILPVLPRINLTPEAPAS